MSTVILNEREQLILKVVVAGGSIYDVAAALGCGYQTAKNTMTDLYDRTGMGSRLELAMWCLHHHPELCTVIGECVMCRVPPREPGGIVFGPEEDRRWPR